MMVSGQRIRKKISFKAGVDKYLKSSPSKPWFSVTQLHKAGQVLQWYNGVGDPDLVADGQIR